MRLLQFAIAFGGVLAFGLFVGSNSLPQLFSDEAQVIALARSVIPAVAVALVYNLTCVQYIVYLIVSLISSAHSLLLKDTHSPSYLSFDWCRNSHPREAPESFSLSHANAEKRKTSLQV